MKLFHIINVYNECIDNTETCLQINKSDVLYIEERERRRGVIRNMGEIRKFTYPKSNRLKIASKNFDETDKHFEETCSKYEKCFNDETLSEAVKDEMFEEMIYEVQGLISAGNEVEAACREMNPKKFDELYKKYMF